MHEVNLIEWDFEQKYILLFENILVLANVFGDTYSDDLTSLISLLRFYQDM
jgi:hypothetical protein